MQILSDLRKRLASALLQTRKTLSGANSGQFRVAALGRGSDFDQLRDYTPGDDVRLIDWKSSARVQRIVVRQYRDERSRTVHVLMDISRSMGFGTGASRLYDTGAEVATVLSVMGEVSGDAMGLYWMGETLGAAVMPRVGRYATERFVHALGLRSPDKQKANFATLLPRFANQCSRRSLVFLISDFADSELNESHFKALAHKHVVAIIRIRDSRELSILEPARFFRFEDSEDGSSCRIPALQNVEKARQSLERFRHEQEEFFNRLHIGWFDCFTGQDTVVQVLTGVRRNQRIFETMRSSCRAHSIC
ncbi:TPA: hypothetical protein DDZ86_04860 [Candidatus Dependentiae bacterium]|nr:MAG: hypothetical protein A2Y17_09665 [Clostridiales bacterium GWF2_38_85]HBL98943.1 hypothetical protein [Candidatus Dependentiae bacterium]